MVFETILIESINDEQFENLIKKLYLKYINYRKDAVHITELVHIDTDLIYINLLEKKGLNFIKENKNVICHLDKNNKYSYADINNSDNYTYEQIFYKYFK